MHAVSFDFGQTLAELDHDFLAQRVRSFGAKLDPTRARAADASAWAAYGAAKELGHARAWQSMMLTFLRAADLAPIEGEAEPGFALEIARKLWEAQPTANLWRKPIPGMFELVAELAEAEIPLGIVSNSEGKMAELLDELGHARHFRIVVDSGRLGIDKPDPRIFEHAARGLGVTPSELLHVGDAWEADVIGARASGAQAIWFATSDGRALPSGVVVCSDATELRVALREHFRILRR